MYQLSYELFSVERIGIDIRGIGNILIWGNMHTYMGNANKYLHAVPTNYKQIPYPQPWMGKMTFDHSEKLRCKWTMFIIISGVVLKSDWMGTQCA